MILAGKGKQFWPWEQSGEVSLPPPEKDIQQTPGSAIDKRCIQPLSVSVGFAGNCIDVDLVAGRVDVGTEGCAKGFVDGFSSHFFKHGSKIPGLF